ncbi:MAG TPA: hypothetical protein VKZ53_19295 [Candidatus Angelobacter sp.]|nr:hypothetical protein [Candidatus Angelobacter sp.]
MPARRYEEPAPISRQEVEEALRSPDGQTTAPALIRMALHERDWQWAERVCLRALSDSRTPVRIAALIALGHLARLHRRLHLELAVPAITRLLGDAECGGTAEDTLEDIAIFVLQASP